MKKDLLDNGARLLDLPQFVDERGGLTFVEQSNHIPFNIKRVYYIYDVPVDKTRGEHAHEELEQVLVAVNGQFDIRIDDGNSAVTITLDNPTRGLYLPGMTWRLMENFVNDTVCLVFASEYYDKEDYVRKYEDFVKNK